MNISFVLAVPTAISPPHGLQARQDAGCGKEHHASGRLDSVPQIITDLPVTVKRSMDLVSVAE